MVRLGGVVVNGTALQDGLVHLLHVLSQQSALTLLTRGHVNSQSNERYDNPFA